jgi:hypothetical protein
MDTDGRWLVRLHGDAHALDRLTQALTTDYLRLEKIDGLHYLSSTDFDGIADPGHVEQLAAHLLEAANGALRVKDPSHSPFAEIAAAIQATSGQPIPQVLRPKPVIATSSVGIPTIQGETPVSHSVAEMLRDRIKLSLTDRDVELTLRYLDSVHLDFADVYKIGEIIERRAGGSEKSVSDRNWATTAEFKRFKRTANYYRHAPDGKRQLPPKPMTLTEAKRFACELVDRWLTDDFTS